MTENTAQTTESTETETVKKTNSVRTWVANHPRIARVAGFTAAGLAVVGAVVAAKNLKDEDIDGLTSTDNVLSLNPSTETDHVAEA